MSNPPEEEPDEVFPCPGCGLEVRLYYASKRSAHMTPLCAAYQQVLAENKTRFDRVTTEPRKWKKRKR